jgi:hypothetical protein
MTASDLFRHVEQPFAADLAKLSDRDAALKMCELLRTLNDNLALFCKGRRSVNDCWADAHADCRSIEASIIDVQRSVKEVA